MRMRRLGARAQGEEEAETKVFRRDEFVRKRKWGWWRYGAFALLALLLFSGGLFFGFYRYLRQQSPFGNLPPEEYAGRLNLLVLGIDGGVNGSSAQSYSRKGRSDVNIVVSIDLDTREVGVLWIPRDTRVYIPDPEVADLAKIGHAYAYGGPELAIATVERFLRVNIHHYVCVNFEAFKQAVDILGGIEFNVPTRMKYDDPYQNLHIDLQPGLQVLNGEQALQLVRFRSYPDGDIGRIRMQEAFLKACLEKALRLSTVVKVPDLIKAITPYVKTDLTNAQILSLVDIGRRVKVDQVKTAMVPGKPQDIREGEFTVSYWVPDSLETHRIIDEVIRGIDRERNASVRVAVQNGSGIQGAGDNLAANLRSMGFPVISVSNAPRQDYPETRVITNADKTEAGALVLRAVRSLSAQAKAYKANGVPEGADVLVIIGKDFVPAAGGAGS